MRKCKRTILRLFVLLLVISILFVPYSGPISKKRFIKYEKGKIQIKKGYMFTPAFVYKSLRFKKLINEFKLKLSEQHESEEKSSMEDTIFLLEISGLLEYKLRSKVLLIEISLIFLAGGFAYILFCLVLRKEKRGEK